MNEKEENNVGRREDYEELFKLADTNGDGFLTTKELLVQMKKFGYKGNDKLFKDIFKKHGQAKKGTLTKIEYYKAMDEAPEIVHQVASLRRIFVKLDSENRGYLTRKDIETVIKSMGEAFTDRDLDELMSLLDKDKNEMIDLEEFISSYINMSNPKKKRKWIKK